MPGFFPFGFAQGQNDKQLQRQQQIPCGDDNKKGNVKQQQIPVMTKRECKSGYCGVRDS